MDIKASRDRQKKRTQTSTTQKVPNTQEKETTETVEKETSDRQDFTSDPQESEKKELKEDPQESKKKELKEEPQEPKKKELKEEPQEVRECFTSLKDFRQQLANDTDDNVILDLTTKPTKCTIKTVKKEEQQTTKKEPTKKEPIKKEPTKKEPIKKEPTKKEPTKKEPKEKTKNKKHPKKEDREDYTSDHREESEPQEKEEDDKEDKEDEEDKKEITLYKIQAGNMSFYGLTFLDGLKSLLKNYINRFNGGYTQKVNIIFKSSTEKPKISYICKVSSRTEGKNKIIELCRTDKMAINFVEFSAEDKEPKNKNNKTAYYKDYYQKQKAKKKAELMDLLN